MVVDIDSVGVAASDIKVDREVVVSSMEGVSSGIDSFTDGKGPGFLTGGVKEPGSPGGRVSGEYLVLDRAQDASVSAPTGF